MSWRKKNVLRACSWQLTYRWISALSMTLRVATSSLALAAWALFAVFDRTTHFTLGFAALDLALGAAKFLHAAKIRSLTCGRAEGDICFRHTWQRVEHLGGSQIGSHTWLHTGRSTHQGAGHPSLPKIQNCKSPEDSRFEKKFHPGG